MSQAPTVCICATCGYTWREGHNSRHDCADVLLARVRSLEAELLAAKEHLLVPYPAPLAGWVSELTEEDYQACLNTERRRDIVDRTVSLLISRLPASPAREVWGPEQCPRVEQTRLHNPPESVGNCFSAVLSGLLKLPIEQIPDFDNPHWRRKLNAWLAGFGLAWVQVEDLAHFRVVYGIEGLWHEIGGESPRDPDVLHAVAGKDGAVEWDPHPSQAGLTNMSEGHGIFIALRPWEFTSHPQVRT